jgi:RsiW-degrading membrane proteinase PrsW (M82 family)
MTQRRTSVTEFIRVDAQRSSKSRGKKAIHFQGRSHRCFLLLFSLLHFLYNFPFSSFSAVVVAVVVVAAAVVVVIVVTVLYSLFK